MSSIPSAELKFIGSVMAVKLQSDKEFREFIERRIAVQKEKPVKPAKTI